MSKISTPSIFPRISNRSRPVACSRSVGTVPGLAPGGRRSSSVLISVNHTLFLSLSLHLVSIFNFETKLSSSRGRVCLLAYANRYAHQLTTKRHRNTVYHTFKRLDLYIIPATTRCRNRIDFSCALYQLQSFHASKSCEG